MIFVVEMVGGGEEIFVGEFCRFVGVYDICDIDKEVCISSVVFIGCD